MIMSAIKYQLHLDNKEKERMNFADYCATEEQRMQTVKDVEHYAIMLCDNLYMDYKIRAMQSHKHYIERGENVEYHQKALDAMYETGANVEFYIEEGRKYYKLIMRYTELKNQNVHAFIDKKTGEVFKPASWKAPAKGVRYNLLDTESRESCYQNADWAGGYLYLR